jgi:thioredoxin-like negative regulator of GroEL
MKTLVPIARIPAASFDETVLRTELPVLVFFSCGDDSTNSHLLHWLSEWTPQAKSFLQVVRVAPAEARSMAEQFGIPSIPALALFHGGAVVYQFCGHFSRRELDEVMTRAAFLGPSRQLGAPSELGASVEEMERER